MRMKTCLCSALCALAAVVSASASDWIPLFNGRDLEGWMAPTNPSSFSVRDGAIVSGGPKAHLFYTGDVGRADFRNFEFTVEVLTSNRANSGVFFHTSPQTCALLTNGFEVQIDNSVRPPDGTSAYRELKKTGSLYAIRNVYKPMARDGEWFTLRFSVVGKRIRTWIGDTLLVDYTEPTPAVAPSKRPGRVLNLGTFALQCHDADTLTFFRNLRVRPLPDDASDPAPGAPPAVDDAYRQMLELQAANFPLMNLHVHLKGGLTLEQALETSRATGIGYGIAINLGYGFPTTNDAALLAYLDSFKGQPCFVGMQAEGREWVKLVSKEVVAKFDYVFTDSMTWTDNRGKRMRLWIPAEVDIPDKQEFMETLVDRTVRIFETEPIDIYVNPTYLPADIVGEYDTLWTPERMQRVVDAAVKNGVAIEINGKSRLPRPAFLKLARAAGAKFSFGTNNRDPDIGDLQYCLDMARELNLTWTDMFVPKPDGRKPVQLRGLP